ncbi:MAG TPA: tetratricopeptide repeat protein [Candidatus Acidoferrales bacterium]|nr:tetratricopeptide repeat protein [Candidatus Acidoferrales bacterium]
MKRVLVTLVLALTTAAWGQGSSPAQQPPAAQPPAAGQQPAGQPPAGQQPAGAGQQANIPTSQKVIKDPAEYNAYITALNTTDPAAKGAAMEAFVAQYPNSIVKIDALEQAMGAYQQANNQQKVEQIARQILAIEPNNVRALAIVVFLERGQVKDAATGAKARADAERGLQELPNWKNPEGVSPADYEKMKNQMANIFAGTAAFGALQQKDYANAAKYYEEALKIDPNDLGNNYQMAIALLESNPSNPLGFWYGAKALSIAQKQNPQAFQAWSPYFLSRYKKYHGNTDDWNQRMAAAATETAPPPNFVASIPLAPTPCDLAAQAVQQNDPSQLSFSDYELVLSCRDKTPANKEAADKVWAFIQAKEKNGEAKLKMPVKVVAVPDPSTLEVAVSDDNQTANKADMRVAMEKPMTKPPAVGANTDVIGVISEYTPDPFMFTMIKGELPAAKPAKTPAKKRAAKKGTKKKASQ